MALNWKDFIGTVQGYFRIGLAGVRLKNNAGNLVVRNAGDTADAELTASKVNVSGNALDINSDAAGSAADWKYTLQRPAAGMTAAVTLTLPVDDGTPSQVLSTDGNGNLSWVSAGSTASNQTVDTTSLAFGSTATTAMFTLPANAVVDEVEIIIDTPFNGTPTVSVGIAGTTAKYMAATDSDLTQPATTSFDVSPNIAASGSSESLIFTYAAGGATAGAARVLVKYAVPA